jgi:exodeoxyribonuclease VII small subunit
LTGEGTLGYFYAFSPATIATLMSNAVEKPPVSFEAALIELESVVHSMEDGNMSLEESLTAYQRGTELMAYCQQALAVAEQKISILENEALREFRPENVAN